jgi:hypothetical protein
MRFNEIQFDTDIYMDQSVQVHSFHDSDFNHNFPESSFDPQAIKDLTGEKNEEQDFKTNEKIFDVIYPRTMLLLMLQLSNIESESTDTSFEDETTQQKRKRNKRKRRRRDNSDNIRKKIKGGFLNRTLIKIMNGILKRHGCKAYFEKFPQKFVSNISREFNKKLLNYTLMEIFEKKELYQACKLNNFYHNLNVIKKIDIRENEELMIILNKKYSELFEQYINSKEFNVYEINRLKENFDDSYIKNYKFLAKHFVEFFANY